MELKGWSSIKETDIGHDLRDSRRDFIIRKNNGKKRVEIQIFEPFNEVPNINNRGTRRERLTKIFPTFSFFRFKNSFRNSFWSHKFEKVGKRWVSFISGSCFSCILKSYIASLIPPGSGRRSEAMCLDRSFRRKSLSFFGKIRFKKRCEEVIFL